MADCLGMLGEMVSGTGEAPTEGGAQREALQRFNAAGQGGCAERNSGCQKGYKCRFFADLENAQITTIQLPGGRKFRCTIVGTGMCGCVKQ